VKSPSVFQGRVASVPVVPARARTQLAPRLARWARTALHTRLADLRWGRLVLRDQHGTRTFGGAEGPCVHVDVIDPGLYTELLLRGTIGAGESFVRGGWRCDDLVGLLRLLVRARDVLTRLDSGLTRVFAALLRWGPARRDNTRRGSRLNIAAHYDLGNDFYELFLDREMMYSSAIFEHDAQSLEDAQLARLESVCAKLDLQPGQRVLEIGTGWGGMALYAARTRGCHVTTTTISRQQFEYARERVARAGLEERVEVLFEDYRDLRGRFDRLISLEMIEAVGERWLDTYFRACSERLAPDGLFLLQSITIRDQYHAEALRSVDFIQRYVFPGSSLPSLAAITERVARVTDLNLVDLHDIGPHYARTLEHWRLRLLRRAGEARALGHGEEFLRLWEFYFAYCEAGFRERSISDVQLLLAKPAARAERWAARA